MTGSPLPEKIKSVRRGPVILTGLGLVALALGIAGLWSANHVPPLVSLATSAPSSPASSASHDITASSPASAGPASRSAQASGVSAGAPVARISIPRLSIHNAPIYDRGIDSKGIMLIAPGYAVTHYAFSAGFGAGNAVIYGHDDINGNIFGHLYDLGAGDLIQIVVGGQTQTYRVSGHQIVSPSDVAVMNPSGDIRLTVITCWPFNVDTKRWIVTAFRA